MKKTLLAVAVLGTFAGVASAQSSVTIYGSLDLAVTKGNGGSSPNNGANGLSKAYIMKQSNASRLGFRGNEDLGGGLSAQFQIEHRFTPDDGSGTPGGQQFWFGRSYVQLTSAAAGSVYLGRDYAPIFYVANKSDPFGWDGVGQLGVTQFALYSTNDRTVAGSGVTSANPGTGSSSRTQNVVGYKSPNIAGLTAQAAYGLGEGTSASGREYGANVEYSAGPIYAAIGFDKTQRGFATVNNNRLINAALHFNFGFAKLMGYYGHAKTGANGINTNKYYSVGALAPIGPGNLKAVYGHLDPQGANNVQKKIAVGYDYSLSKRTTVYADVGHGRATNLSNNTAYAFGVKHTF